jgi:hypothetical protein
LQAGEELAHVERLREIVVCAELEPDHDHARILPPGDLYKLYNVLAPS